MASSSETTEHSDSEIYLQSSGSAFTDELVYTEDSWSAADEPAGEPNNDPNNEPVIESTDKAVKEPANDLVNKPGRSRAIHYLPVSALVR